MGNYTLNPAVITAQGNQMPQFDNRAQYTQPTALAGSYPGNPSVANSAPSFGGSGLVGSLIGAGAGLISGALDRNFERQEAAKQRDWNESMLEKQNQWNIDMWNMTNEYNTPANQLARMKEAGLNPLYYGLDGSSANAMQSAQALGYDRASARGLTNPILAGLKGYMDMRAQDKQIELQNAQIDKIKADTESTQLDSEWKDKTMDARVEAEQLGNKLTEETIEKIKKEKDKMSHEIDLIDKQANTEIARKAALEAQKALDEARYKEVTELLPYRKLLMEAETEAQKASAAASYAHAAYERGLLSAGYIDAMVQSYKASARDKEAQAAAEELENSIKNGTFFGDGWAARHISGPLLRGMTAFNETFLPIFRTVGTIAGIGLASRAAKSITNNTTNNTTRYDISDKARHLGKLRSNSSIPSPGTGFSYDLTSTKGVY